MTPSDEQRAASRAIQWAAVNAARANDDALAAAYRLRETIRAAHAARVPIAHIAADAGVTRQTVYRWIRDDTP